MREFESHQETIGKLDAMRVERNTQSAHLAEMGRELRAVEEQNAALRAALGDAVQGMVSALYRLKNPTMGGEHIGLGIDKLEAAKNAARKALGVDHG